MLRSSAHRTVLPYSGLWVPVLVWMLVALAPAPLHAEPSTLKVAFVSVGPIGDFGWNYSHEKGRKYLEKTLGKKVKTTHVESVPESDVERTFRQLARRGYGLIVGTSFGYMDPMVRVSKQFPQVAFIHCSGFKTTKNMGNYYGRMYQPGYLAGIVAGFHTESNLIGYVAPHPIPIIVNEINAFALGVRSVNPNASVKVVWSNTWHDPAKSKDAALSLLDVGADVIASAQDSPAPLQAAEERDAVGFGYHNDMRQFAPEAFLTAPVWNWGPYYVRVAREVLNGTFEPESYWGGMEDGVVELASLSDHVNKRARERVQRVKKQFKAGSFTVFSGPIRDRSGSLRIPEGESLSDEKLGSMDWFVQGVEGSIPD